MSYRKSFSVPLTKRLVLGEKLLVVVRQTATIGREPDADIPIEGVINPSHAVIANLHDKCSVIPLWNEMRQSNTVIVDGVRKSSPTWLEDGAKVAFDADGYCQWTFRSTNGKSIFLTADNAAVAKIAGRALTTVLILDGSCQIGGDDSPIQLLDIPGTLYLRNNGSRLSVESDDLIMEEVHANKRTQSRAVLSLTKLRETSIEDEIIALANSQPLTARLTIDVV